jgi:hypothetical protein
LYRRKVDQTSIRSPSLGSGSQDGVLDEPEGVVNHVTAIAVALNGAFLFVGKGSGSVSVHDAKTGLVVATLFSHQSSVKMLHHFTKGSMQTILSADSNNVLMAHRVIRDKAAWATEPLYTYRGHLGNIRQLLISPDSSKILLGYQGHAIFLDADSGSEIAKASLEVLSEGALSFWTQHPTLPNSLLCFQGLKVALYSWSSLGTVLPDDRGMVLSGFGDSETRVHSVMPLSAGRSSLLFVTLIHPPYGPRGPFTYRCFEASALDASEEADIRPIPGTELVCNAINAVLGTYRERLVFLHKDGWICSTKVTSLRQAAATEAIAHHFAPPSDWLLASKMLMQLTRLGDVLFVVRGDVAVLKRGLERNVDMVINSNGNSNRNTRRQ